MVATTNRACLTIVAIVLCFTCISARRRYREFEELVTVLPFIGSGIHEPFHEIPATFEVRAAPEETFKRYVREIGQLAKKKDLEVIYKVMVETRKPRKSQSNSLNKIKHVSPKQYIMPAKKKPTYSQFDKPAPMFQGGTEATNEVIRTTTEEVIGYYGISTKSIRYKKYKPVPKGVKSKFKKTIRPVKNRIITIDLE